MVYCGGNNVLPERCANTPRRDSKELTQAMDTVYHATQLPLFILSKICKTCGTEKPIDDFYYHKPSQCHQAHCKACVCAKSAKRYLATHPPIESPIPVNGGKICKACSLEKSYEDFGRNKNRKNGYNDYCKQCANAINRRNKAKRGYKRSPLPPAVNGGKVCSTCRIEKSYSEFPRTSRSKDGYAWQCKSCLYARNRANYAAIENKEHIAEKHHQWYEANREQHRALIRKWTKENPLKANETSRRYQARKRNARAERVSYKRILERDGLQCYICQKAIDPTLKRGPASLTFDHEKPLAGKGEKRGMHTEDNIHPAHLCCNSRKCALLLSEMTEYQRRGPDTV